MAKRQHAERRLDQWAKAGVSDQLHLEVLDRLGLAGRLDWSRAAWTRPACAPSVWDHVGANPVGRGKPGSKLHLVSERHGLPLTAAVTAANVNDTVLFAALLDHVPAVLIPHHARRLAVRWDRESGRWFGFVLLACALVLQAALTAAGLVLQHGRVAAERPQ